VTVTDRVKSKVEMPAIAKSLLCNIPSYNSKMSVVLLIYLSK